MRNLYIVSLLFCNLLITRQLSAQNVLSNRVYKVNNSCNNGRSHQFSSDVINSTPGVKLIFSVGITLEYVWHFYIAKNIIWSYNNIESTACLGYSPIVSGSNLPHQGVGIKSTSADNIMREGGCNFGNIELNVTKIFLAIVGVYTDKPLASNANRLVCNITINPKTSTPDLSTSVVAFVPTAIISGANHTDYMNGYGSINNVVSAFILPPGHNLSLDKPSPSLTIDSIVNGTRTTRYLDSYRHPTNHLGTSFDWISSIGNGPLSEQLGIDIIVELPSLSLFADDVAYLRLADRDEHLWTYLNNDHIPNACTIANCLLRHRLTNHDHVTDLAIGLYKNPINIANQTVWLWLNPT